MATRSRIAVEVNEGNVISVYCHWDGYPEGVGKQLLDIFPDGTDSALVEEFINEGDRSTVEISYKAWRGEECPPVSHEGVAHFFNGDIQNWGYLYTREGQWLVKGYYSEETPAPVLLSGLLAKKV